jgi:3-hydroxyacyl-CoA dehydrogenase/enoyl-CoA hydratase/3-hydroxybutyryl-CoA epimerase
MQKLMNGPLKGMVAAQGAEAGGEARASRALPGALRHHRHVGELRRQCARRAGRQADLDRCAAIAARRPTRNLVRVFFLQERLKGFGKDGRLRAAHVHVIGAGVMGGDIAAWCALRGMTVTLQDQNIERIAPAIQRARRPSRRSCATKTQVRFALDRLIPDPSGEGVRQADVIIEAIFENLEAKRKLFADIEAHRQAGCRARHPTPPA